jgi:hypothetical protein
MVNNKENIWKIKIKNSFWDFISFISSFIISFFRSFLLFFWKKNIKVRNYFFGFLDFIFRIWPKYFWKKPTWLKFTRFFGNIIEYIFFKK